MKPNRRVTALLIGATLLALSFVPGCRVGYLIKSGYFQAELLASRVPVDEVRATGKLTEKELSKLDLIADVKAWGANIGLSATDNYETIAQDWSRTIWNVSACNPVAFEPKRWWFPIVGSMPYLGYFREQDARRTEARLAGQGYDVYVRTAGAYSTLGWFKDPILPKMLTWSDFSLADTVLHELAHATLWVPGSVKFNESFANYVGEVAALRYLADRRGHHAPALVQAVNQQSDRKVYRDLLHQLYQDLDAVYTDASLSDAQKLAEKDRLFHQELPRRVEEAPLAEKARYLKSVEKGPWNNARMVQFKTYNTNEEVFAAVLVEVDGDLLAFIDRVREITEGRKDPFRALREAMGIPEPDSSGRNSDN
ncbi:MAG: aminopeptidase [Alphaproteobacteria bacterium]|nr:aminopeptidase [Alphaproteobacteria bacterium]